MFGKAGHKKQYGHLITGILLFFLVLFLLLSICAVLLRSGSIGEAQMKLMVCACLFISSLLASVASVSGCNGKRLLIAAVPAVVFLFLMLTAHFLVPTGIGKGSVIWTTLFSVIFPSVVVGLVHPKKKRR